MLNRVRTHSGVVFTALVTALFSGVAAASGGGSSMPAPDVSDAVAYIQTNGSTALAAIGGVLITLAALVLVYKWAKAALF